VNPPYVALPPFMYFSQAYTMAAFADPKKYNSIKYPIKPQQRYDGSQWSKIQNGEGPPYTSLEVPSDFQKYPCPSWPCTSTACT
jgi:hypothetical protein